MLKPWIDKAELVDRLREEGCRDKDDDRQSELRNDEPLANPELRGNILSLERANHAYAHTLTRSEECQHDCRQQSEQDGGTGADTASSMIGPWRGSSRR